MRPVSMSSPENSRPLGLLFSNNPNYGCPCFQEFPENSIFETYKCYDPFCIGKNRLRLSIFWMNQKILSIFQKILSFFEKIHFWKFLQVFWPILYGKKILNFRFSIFWMNHKFLSNFLKNSILENFYKCFDPFCMGRNWFWDFQFSGWIRRFWAFFKK